MNDDRDAKAIAAAARQFVKLKSEAQLDMPTPHRARDGRRGDPSAIALA